jgi:hypothetical protein
MPQHPTRIALGASEDPARTIRRVREQHARLAEAAIAAGRASEIPALIRAGASAGRLPRSASAAPPALLRSATKPHQAGERGFVVEGSAERWAAQMGRSAPQ